MMLVPLLLAASAFLPRQGSLTELMTEWHSKKDVFSRKATAERIRACVTEMKRIGRAEEALESVGQIMMHSTKDLDLRSTWPPSFLFSLNKPMADALIIECWVTFGFYVDPCIEMLRVDEKRFFTLLVKALDIHVAKREGGLGDIDYIVVRSPKYEWVLRRYLTHANPKVRKSATDTLLYVQQNRAEWLKAIERGGGR